MRWILGAVACAQLAWCGTAADLARGVREILLDPEQCYRVRELTLAKEDARIFFTDGHLIFSKPVAGRPIAAVFTADVEGGDAEVILMPPTRAERRSLALYSGSPNLDEHVEAALLLFSDDTAAALMAQIQANPFNRKSPEVGPLLEQHWASVVRNLAASFQARLALDLLSSPAQRRGLLAVAFTGRKLGNFDLVVDPRSLEQIVLGQVAERQNRLYFDIWTSFQSRTARKAGFEDPDRVKIGSYEIAATLTPELDLRVVTRMRLRAESSLAVVPFDIAREMQVSGVTVNGTPAELFQRESLRSSLIRNTGNDLILVTPPQPLETGREYIFEFRHAGRVVFDAGNHVYFVGARGNWYPHHGVQFATYDLTFRYPRDLDLVTAGDAADDRTDGEWRITHRKTPVPVRLAGFNLGRYEHARVARAGYSVEVYANRNVEKALERKVQEPVVVLPPAIPGRRRAADIVTLPPAPSLSPASRVERLAGETASALEYMAARFGAPALRQVRVSPVPGTFGQGFPGLIYLSTLAYFGREERPVATLNEHAQVFYTEILHAHEIAHQWWGNVVTSNGYHDEWIMEALANYSALLYLEKRKGARLLETVLGTYRTSLLAKLETGQTVESAGPIVLGIRLDSSQTPQAWRRITYEKGSWIIHMLRRRMGDERFFAMLAALRKRYEYRTIDTEQFRVLAAEFLPPKSADPKLEDFFDRWIYGTGVPALKLTYTLKGKAPALRVTGTVQQSEVAEDFTTLVPVEIQVARGRSLTHWVKTGADPVPFSVAVRQRPTKVSLDPEGSVLKR